MQVDPIKPTLRALEYERLKLKCDELLSNVAFKINLRRYTPPPPSPPPPDDSDLLRSTFYGLTFDDMSSSMVIA